MEGVKESGRRWKWGSWCGVKQSWAAWLGGGGGLESKGSRARGDTLAAAAAAVGDAALPTGIGVGGGRRKLGRVAPKNAGGRIAFKTHIGWDGTHAPGSGASACDECRVACVCVCVCECV